MENRDETKTNVIAFYNSIENDIIRPDQMETAISWLAAFAMSTYIEFRATLKNLYILLIDFIYFDNQNMLIGYKIKELAKSIEEDKETGTEPYADANKDYKDIIINALLELTMKHKMTTDEFSELKEKVLSNEDLSLEMISDRGTLMQVLGKYTKDEKYIW